MEIKKYLYIPRVDAFRTILIAMLVIGTYSLPFPYAGYLTILFNYAQGALFALYGFFVLRTGASLKKNILRTLRLFLIMLAVYFPLTNFYMWFVHNMAFSWINLPNILTFLIFNRWPVEIGSNIWLVQSVLYALLIFSIFQKISIPRKVEWIICAVLLILSAVFGDLADLLHMPFYLETNFLTVTIPYMLLGKLLRHVPEKLRTLPLKKMILIFFAGILLCAAEVFVLNYTGHLKVYDQLIGFLPMTVVTVLLAVRGPGKPFRDYVDIELKKVYRLMYVLYNPIAEFYYILTIFLVGFPTIFSFASGSTGLIAVLLSFFLARLIARKNVQALIRGEAQVNA